MILTGETEVLEENAVPLSYVNQKPHTIWHPIEPGTPPCSMAAVHIIISHVTDNTFFLNTSSQHFVSSYFAFAVVQLKCLQYVAAVRRHVVAHHRRFGRAYCFHFKAKNSTNLPGFLDYWAWQGYVVSKRRWWATTWRYAAPSTFQDLTSPQVRFLGTQTFWAVTPCRWVRVSRRFRRIVLLPSSRFDVYCTPQPLRSIYFM